MFNTGREHFIVNFLLCAAAVGSEDDPGSEWPDWRYRSLLVTYRVERSPCGCCGCCGCGPGRAPSHCHWSPPTLFMLRSGSLPAK